jgi:hypothetical protein
MPPAAATRWLVVRCRRKAVLGGRRNMPPAADAHQRRNHRLPGVGGKLGQYNERMMDVGGMTRDDA